MLLQQYTFESAASGFLMRVYPFGNMFVTADEAYFGDGGYEEDFECVKEMTEKEPQCFMFNSKRRAVNAAKYAC